MLYYGPNLSPPPFPLVQARVSLVLNAGNLSITSGNGQTGNAGQSLSSPLGVNVTDGSGNAVSGVSVSFQITQQPPSSGAALSTTTAITGIYGVASTSLTLGSAPGQYQVTASCSSCNPASVTFTETAACVLTSPAFSWTQGQFSFSKTPAPWGTAQYDHSYLADVDDVPSKMGSMQFFTGPTPATITLSPTQNTITGLAAALKTLPGINAVVTPDATTPLSVYNSACGTQPCLLAGNFALHLCDGACLPGWSNDLLSPRLMENSGCAVTALAMACSYSSVSHIVTSSGQLQFDPGQLNAFMSNTLLLPALYLPPLANGIFYNVGDFGVPVNGMVKWDETVDALAVNVGDGNLTWVPSTPRVSSSPTNYTAAYAALDNALCTEQVPMIAKVASQNGPHFVLVTGNAGTGATDGSQYTIADPGYNTQTLANYNNSFTTVGVVQDPQDKSKLIISTDDNATLLVTDSGGRETGVDPLAGIVQQVPSSSYGEDQIFDDITGGSSTGVTHSVSVVTPQPSTYQIKAAGIASGTFTLHVSSYATDGSRSLTDLLGLSSFGSTVAYNIQYSSTPGTASQVFLAASSQGTVPSTQVSTTASGLAYSRVSQTFVGTVTINNISNSTINGPLQIVLTSLTAGVTLANATGTLTGIPYLTVPAMTSLAPGQSATVSVQFKNPSNATINFAPVLYSGSIN